MQKLFTGRVVLAGFLGACGGSSTTETPMQVLDPQLSLLTPSSAFAGRVVDLQISAVDTSFDATSVVSLGDPGIVISNVAIGDRVNLRFTATIAPSATLGLHDLTVTTAGASSKLAGGFLVRAPLQGEAPPIGAPVPVAAQGSLTTVFLRNLDYVQNPFVTSVTATRLISGLNTIQSTAGFTGARLSGPVLVDALTPSGMTVQAQLVSLSPFVQPMSFVTDPTDANLPKPAARTATPVTAGAALPGQVFSMPADSGFYTLNSAQDNQILLAQLSALGTSLQPPNGTMQGAVAPASGKYSDGNFAQVTYNVAGTLGTLLGLLGTAGPQFLTVWPGSFGGGGAAQFGYTLTPRLLMGSRFSAVEAATPDSAAMPLHAIASLDTTTGHYTSDGAFDRPGDIDYVLYSAVPAANRVYVTVAAPGAAFTVSEYVNSTCAGATAASAFANNFAAIEAPTGLGQHCITVSVSGNTPRYPVTYKLIIAAQ